MDWKYIRNFRNNKYTIYPAKDSENTPNSL